MTPALKAMVEAMVGEVARQVYTDYTREDPSPEPFVNDLLVDGRLDLEKVARAGLEAICVPSEAHAIAMHEAARLRSNLHHAYSEVWAAGVAHVLGLTGDPASDAQLIIGGIARMGSHSWAPSGAAMKCSRCGLTDAEAAGSLFRCGGDVGNPDAILKEQP